MADNITNIDLYKFLGVADDSTEKEVRSCSFLSYQYKLYLRLRNHKLSNFKSDRSHHGNINWQFDLIANLVYNYHF